MIAYIIRRLAGAVPLLLFISVVTYAMMALAPGGPAAILGPRGALSPAVMARINALYGLDKPWFVQYFYWLKQLVLHGSLGASYVDQRPVVEKVLERLPVTIEMVGLALLLTLLIAIPIGIYAGAHRGSLFDNATSAVGFAFYGMPVFWLSIVLIDLFAVQLRWFPSSGLSSLGREDDPFDRLWHLVLPVVAIALVSFDMGGSLGLKGFVAATLGGIGSVPGAVVGGILIGVIESVGAGIFSSGWRDAIVFGVLIVVLFVRPEGLFGRSVARV